MPSFDVRGRLENSYFKKIIPMELIDSSGKVVGQTTSNAMGIYRFDDVPAGEYEVRVQPEFVKQNRLITSPDKTEISVTGKAGIKTVPFMGIISK
ncbi:Cna protein B-type domain protein [compost metagenome]